MTAKLHYSLFIGIFCLLYSFEISSQNIFSGEPVQWVGTPNGFSTSPYNSDYRTLGFRRVSVASGNPTDGRGQWATTINVQNSGGDIQPSNMPGGGSGGWLFISGPSGNRFQNKWAFGGVGQGALNSPNTMVFQGSTDMGLNMSTPGRYTFVMRDNGYSSTNFYVGYTANDPVSVTRTGASFVNGQAVVSISSSAAPSSGENIFVRYRVGTNSFSSNTEIVQATGSGTSWTATIPAQSCGSTIYYYVFTSTRSLSQLNGDSEQNRSLCVLRYDDAFGVNYSITSNAATSSVISGEATVCEGESTNIQVQITGGIGPFNVVINDGNSTFSVDNYTSNSPIEVTPDQTSTYSLVSVTGADGCLSASLSGNPTVTVQIPTLWYADSDGDGFGNPDDSIESCDQPDGYVDNNLDCDDSDDTITTAQIWYFDNDEDGFGDDSITLIDCFQPFGYVAQGGDCNDNDATIYPGATEICYDGILQNCDGELTDGCPAVTTTFWSSVCDATLPAVNTSIRPFTTFINQLPSGVSVTGYNFRITNLATSAVREVEKSTAMIRITETDIANFGTDYFVEVSIRLNAEWQPYGPGCIISTPALPTTTLNATSCGATLPVMQSRVFAATVTGATGYRFEVSRMSGATAVQTLNIETTGNSFRLTDVPGLVMLYDTEYQVRVQVRSLVEGSEVYSSFGSVCSVFTPDAPEAAMIGCDAEAGLAPSTLTTLNYATAISDATLYRFTLTDGVYNQVLTTPTRGFRLSQFNALSPLTAGATYTVFVEVQLYGVFYAGKDCTITVPGGSILIRALEEGTEAITTTFDGFKAIASPNPFQGSFNLNVYTNSTQPVGVAIYDMTGRLLETREVGVDVLSGQLFGERYPSGVYNIVVTQDEEMHTVRVIKK